MLRTAKRTASRYDTVGRLNQQDVVSGKIIPSRVRTLHSIPITVLPELDAPAESQDFVTGIGYYLVPLRIFLWKPAGSAYVGAAGNFQVRGNTTALYVDSSLSAALQSTNAYSLAFNGAFNNPAAQSIATYARHEFFFATADVTGDGPPLYYTIFFIRVPISAPLQRS
jgi:hypothetical protein